MTRQQYGPKLEILQTAINTCLIINIFIIMAHMKKKKKKIQRNKNYVTYWKMIILI